VSLEIVQKIDKNFLEHGTREQFREAILALLEVVQAQAQEIRELRQRVLVLENEVQILRGEKKRPALSRLSRRSIFHAGCCARARSAVDTKSAKQKSLSFRSMKPCN
jgi:hypothetical protein